jgi:hypothetical protein
MNDPLLNIPAELRDRPQWVVWRAEPKNDGRITKVPYAARTGRKASTTSPGSWCSFTEARTAFERAASTPKPYSGRGFVFSHGDPFCGVDLDKCRDATTGEIQPDPLRWAKSLASFTEISPSGTGLHVIVRATTMEPGRRKAGVEVYSSARFFCMTGQTIEGFPTTIEERQAQVDALMLEVFGEKKEPRSAPKPKPGRQSNSTVNLSVRQEIAGKLLGVIRWESPTLGYTTCPGIARHTTGDAPRDCRITLDGAPTCFCFHASCEGIIAGLNHELRSRIGKAEATAAPKPVEKPSEDHGNNDAAWQALLKTHGEPFFLNVKGAVSALNEKFFAALFAAENRVIFVPEEERFYLYDDATGLWTRTGNEIVCCMLAERVLAASRDLGVSSLARQASAGKLSGVLVFLRGLVAKEGAFIGKTSHFVHLSNGVVRFGDEITLTGYRPEDYSRNRSPIHFAEGATCPRFLNEVVLPAMTADDAALLQRYFGLCLFGHNLPQRFLILDGDAGTGKGCLIRTLQGLVGPTNCQQLRTRHLEDRFETSFFAGKTLLIGSDVEGEFLQHEGASVLKSLVGGDPLSGQRKFSNDTVAFHGSFNVVVTCNERLRIKLSGDSGAWRRRLLIVRFSRPRPPKPIPDFDRLLLREEGAGVLAWALDGFAMLRRDLDTIGDFHLTAEQLARVDALLDESDSLQRFVIEAVQDDPDGTVTVSEAVEEYVGFCVARQWSPLPTRQFETRIGDLVLERFGISRRNDVKAASGRQVRGWYGIRLAP